MPNHPLHYVTLSGVPINVTDLKWPFHPSTSGADWLMQQEPAMKAAMQKGVDAGLAANKITA